MPVVQHAQDLDLSGDGTMHEGEWSARTGMPGIPGLAEDVMVARDLVLVEETGGRYHVAHLSTARNAAMVREAKRRGLRVTCEVTPHHLLLTDRDVAESGFHTHLKMNPPLRAEGDRAALIAAMLDGTVDAIASDHAPHTSDEKCLEFEEAPFGIIGLETTLGLCLDRLVRPGLLPLAPLIELLTLIQAAGPGFEAVIDPLAEELDLAPFLALMSDHAVLKVFHAARQDLEIFLKLGDGALPHPVFDTQIAAMARGFGDSVAYDALVQQMLKRRLDKSSRFTDWSRRPLSDSQLAYALADVTHLRDLYPRMRHKLETAERLSWLDEEHAYLLDPAIYDTTPENAWRRLKLRKTTADYVLALQVAAAWRERQAHGVAAHDGDACRLATRRGEDATLPRVLGVEIVRRRRRGRPTYAGAGGISPRPDL